MDKKITDFLVKEIKIGKWMLAPIDLLLFVAAAVFSVMIRISVVDYTAIELPAFVKYGNMLSFVTGITDLLLAVLGSLIIYDLTERKIRAFLTYAILMMLPVLCASCAMWGMGDSIYIFFAVLSLYLLMKGKGNASLVSYGISLFLSRYAFFLLPVYAIAFMQKKNKLMYFIFPFCGVWFRNGIVHQSGYLPVPSFEMERMFVKLRGESLLSQNWPNIFQMIGTDKFIQEYSLVAKVAAASLMLLVIMLVLLRSWKMSGEGIWYVGLVLSILIPYVMPQMDERAGLLSCVLYLLFAMKHPDLYYLAIVQVIITYISFSAYFRGESVIPLSAVALAELFVLLLTIRRADHVFKVQQEEAR